MGLFSKNKIKVYIDGMNCSHCSARVEGAFNTLPRTKAKVDLEEKCAYISTSSDFSDEAIKAIVEKTGFTFVKIER